jgi:hypothetical protein
MEYEEVIRVCSVKVRPTIFEPLKEELLHDSPSFSNPKLVLITSQSCQPSFVELGAGKLKGMIHTMLVEQVILSIITQMCECALLVGAGVYGIGCLLLGISEVCLITSPSRL